MWDAIPTVDTRPGKNFSPSEQDRRRLTLRKPVGTLACMHTRELRECAETDVGDERVRDRVGERLGRGLV